MTLYRYTHDDGRTGVAKSAWYAMLAAIGSEAERLNLTHTVWTPTRHGGSHVGDSAIVYADKLPIGKLENIGP